MRHNHLNHLLRRNGELNEPSSRKKKKKLSVHFKRPHAEVPPGLQ